MESVKFYLISNIETRLAPNINTVSIRNNYG